MHLIEWKTEHIDYTDEDIITHIKFGFDTYQEMEKFRKLLFIGAFSKYTIEIFNRDPNFSYMTYMGQKIPMPISTPRIHDLTLELKCHTSKDNKRLGKIMKIMKCKGKRFIDPQLPIVKEIF